MTFKILVFYIGDGRSFPNLFGINGFNFSKFWAVICIDIMATKDELQTAVDQ